VLVVLVDLIKFGIGFAIHDRTLLPGARSERRLVGVAAARAAGRPRAATSRTGPRAR
jgi:hypothetical protein